MNTTWVFSDLHLRPGGSAAVGCLADLVRKERPRMLVGLGDVLELLFHSYEEIMEDKDSFGAIQTMKMLAETVETLWIPGNHDLELEDHRVDLAPIKIMPMSLDLEGTRFEHGHRADPLTRCLWDPVCGSVWWSPSTFRDLCQCLCPPLHRLLYPTPWELKNKSEEGWKWYCSAYEVVYEGFVQRDSMNYVHGHTHQPFAMQMMGGLWLANSGDLCDSMSFLEIVEDKMKLRFLEV